MGGVGSKQDWEQWTGEALTAVEAWQASHPRATLTEIEQAVDGHFAATRARLIEALALAEESAVSEQPACAACGTAMVWDGVRTRRLRTTHEQTVELTRRYRRCPRCGAGFSPPR